VNIQHSLAAGVLLWSERKFSIVKTRSDDNNKSTTLSMHWSMLELMLQLSAIFTTWSKPEVYLHHTTYFHTETLAIILELFSILYHCYYSQNYSGIIISGLERAHVSSSCSLSTSLTKDTCSPPPIYIVVSTRAVSNLQLWHWGQSGCKSDTVECVYNSI